MTGDGGFAQYSQSPFNGRRPNSLVSSLSTIHGPPLDFTSPFVLILHSAISILPSPLPVWKTDLHNPDFSKYAEICRGKGFRVTRADELEPAIAAARDHVGPALVETITDPDLV